MTDLAVQSSCAKRCRAQISDLECSGVDEKTCGNIQPEPEHSCGGKLVTSTCFSYLGALRPLKFLMEGDVQYLAFLQRPLEP